MSTVVKKSWKDMETWRNLSWKVL